LSAIVRFGDVNTEACELNIPLADIRGLILGDIFGLIAGLTRVEETLFLFFKLRPALDSDRLVLPCANAGVVGDATALSIGLGFPDRAAPADGVLKGPNLGVFRAFKCGVAPSSLCKVVSMRESRGLSNEGSGSVRSSSIGMFPESLRIPGDC
jgi:hypothetical protein